MGDSLQDEFCLFKNKLFFLLSINEAATGSRRSCAGFLTTGNRSQPLGKN